MRLLFLFFLTSCASTIFAQLARYPYIQSTDQNSTIIAWKTSNDVIGKVAYGLTANNLSDTISETNAGKRHALTLNNLIKDTTYYYAILSGNNLETAEFFSTASDSTNQQFNFLHYGDCGYNSTMQRIIASLMEAEDADFAVITGDIDQGGVPHISESEGGDDYDEIFFDVYNDGVNHSLLSHQCHYPAIGNHDVYANNGATYEAEFYLPHNNPDSTERYYSYEWGDAKFIALDVITPFDPTSFPINQLPIDQRWWTDFRQGSPQYEFLENELKCNDKKWVFVYFHEGPWTNYWGPDYYLPNALGGDYYQYEGNVMVRQHLVPLFEQYGVDFVLVGHSHLYEQAFKNGVWYITSGGAGDVGGNTQYANHPEILKAIVDNMYIKFDVDSNTVSYDVINDNNQIIDTFSLTKPYTKYEVNATITQPSCFGYQDGEIQLNVTGPKPPYTIEWMDGTIGNTIVNIGEGTYYAFIKNAYDCEKVVSFELENPPMLMAEIISTDSSFDFCFGDSLILTTLNEYDQYQWSNGDTSSSIQVTSVDDWSVTVIDSNQCVAISPQISTHLLDEPDATFAFANSDSIYNFLSTNPTANTYIWNFDDGTIDTTTTDLITHTFEENGSYEVKLIAMNSCGNDTLTRTVIVDSYSTSLNNLYIKNGFVIIPNPMKNFAVLQNNFLHQPIEISIQDVLGREIYHSITADNELILNKEIFGTGTYIVYIKDNNEYYSIGRLIVQ